MFTTHINDTGLHSDSTRRGFLRAGTMAFLSAGIWLGGERIAFGQSAAGTDAESQSPKTAFQLTRSKFTPHLSESFLIKLNGEEIYLQLVDVTDLKQPSVSKSALLKVEDPLFKAKLHEESFTLRFRSLSGTLLPQKTWLLEQEALGKIELFLVPVGIPDGPWHFYEAVFNRLQS
ncbi:MAG: hypothetical protein ABI977_02655 [Acidobacteriota bacterium]